MIDKVRELLKRFTRLDWILLLVVAIGVIILVFSWLKKAAQKPIQVEYIAAGRQAGEQSKIWVDVAGAVVNPGVYQVVMGSRVKDALVAAGGLAGQADRDFVTKIMNLAAVVKDGEKIFVPEVRDQLSEISQPKSELININSASMAELEQLWGVGESRARMIVDGRPYGSIDELITKKILPQNVYDRVKANLSVY